MNSKLKALAITVGFGVWALAVAFGLQYLSKIITVEQGLIGVAIIGISVCFYMIYSLVLTQIEFSNKLKDMVDRK